MNELLVAFGRHQVALRTNQDEAHASLARSFCRMAGGVEPRETVATVTLEWAGGRFRGVAADGVLTEFTALEPATRWARYQAIERLIDARGDLIWFHGGAVGSKGRAVVIPGRRGRGKSTMVTVLWRRGCTFLTDDILPIDPASDRILPFPQLPAVRTGISQDLSEEELGGVPKDEIAVAERVEPRALEPAAFVLPAFIRGVPARLVRCSIGEAALAMLEGCWNLARYREAAAAYVARLGGQLPVCRIEFSEPERAGDVVAAWLDPLL